MKQKIFRSIVGVSLLVLIAGLLLIAGVLYYHFSEQMQSELHREADYIAEGINSLGIEYLEQIQERQKRLTLIGSDGTVYYDNKADIEMLDNHLAREEVRDALKNGSGKSERYSETLQERTLYYALRLEDGSILRMSVVTQSIVALLLQTFKPICIMLFVVFLVAGIVASTVARKLIEPINNLDLEHPEENQTYEEMAPLLGKIKKQSAQINHQLRKANRKKEEFDAITEHMKEGLIIIGKKMEVLSYNKAAVELLSDGNKPTVGSALAFNRSEVFCKALEEALKGKAKEVMLTHGNKEYQVLVNPVFQEEEVKGAVVLVLDITEKVQREYLRREFTANVSHELKTPLTSISGFAELIKSGLVKTEDVEEFATRIYNEAGRLITLVNDIIRLSRLEEGDFYEKEVIDVKALLSEVLDGLEVEAKKNNIFMEIKGDEFTYEAPKQMIGEMLHNLCENAIKYNKPGGKVMIHMQADKEKKVITVTDTGIGIPMEYQERVFERFFRVDKSHSKKIGGTGLGLSIVKHSVDYLGGQVYLKSEIGAGTQVKIELPC